MNLQLIKILLLAWFHFCAVKSCPHGWNPSTSDATKCYYVAQTTMTWQDAENYCQTLGPNSHLTSVLSSFETNEISAIVSKNPTIGSTDQVWIGAKGNTGDLKFFWSDGSPFVYQNWQTGQPNLNFPCVSSLAKTSGRWYTESCATKNYVVCKYIMMPTKTPTDCYDYYFNKGNATDGIYRISPPGIQPFDVYCDMTTEGGGWTVFQKRLDDSTRFWDRPWGEYKNGFNTNQLAGNHWLGLDRIHILSTKDANVTLRIDLLGNRCTVCDPWSNLPNTSWFQEWGFSIADESDAYRLHLTPYTAGNITTSTDTDYFHASDNQKFSTADRNNDVTPCVTDFVMQLGAWWGYNVIDGCNSIALNGAYNSPNYNGYQFGFCFEGDHFINPFRSEMKIRKQRMI